MNIFCVHDWVCAGVFVFVSVSACVCAGVFMCVRVSVCVCANNMPFDIVRCLKMMDHCCGD